jgi:putative protein-disulfide isomerase
MNRLIYIADPMCSWCYGFVPEMQRLMEHYKNRLRFSLIMGGLRPGGGDPWNEEMKGFLRHHWEEITEKTKQPFNFNLLERSDFHYDTEPPCRAVVVVRDLMPEKTFSFYKAIQHAFYYLNQNPNELEFYLPICDSLGIAKDAFEEKFYSEEYKNKTLKDFAHSRQLGIRGFPSIVLANETSIRLVTHGYSDFETMKNTLEGLLVNEKN